MNRLILVSCALVALFLTGCPRKEFLVLPGPVKVERKAICGGTNNCGVLGQLRAISGENPRTMPVADNGEADIAELLGNRLDDSYLPAKVCGSALPADVVERAKRGGELYQLEINYTGSDISRLKASLKAGLAGRLSSSASGKAAFEAVIDRTVDETTKGTYTATMQSYNLNSSDSEQRAAACKAALGSGKYVLGLAVIQFSANATNELKKKLIASLVAEASANADLRAAVLDTSGNLEASLARDSDLIVKTAAANINRVVLVGFAKF